MIKLPDAMIKRMDYQTRQKRFNEEKEELFSRMRNSMPEEISAELKKLIKKWRV